MNDTRNLANMTVDDLLDARRTVMSDEGAAALDRRLADFPERYRIHILKRRGELRSLSERGRVVGYSSPWYIGSLLLVTSVLLAINILTLSVGHWLALIPVLIQSALLGSLALRHYSQVYLVRLWAIVAALGGVSFLVSQLAQGVVIALATEAEQPEPISMAKLLLGILELGAGIYFFKSAISATKFELAEHEPKNVAANAV
jgi:hypothetical protein